MINERLFIGKEVVELDRVDSTNNYIKQLVAQKKSFIEGMVVVAYDQFSGRGQMGNAWTTLAGKNLTFSLALKPNLTVDQQFLMSQVIALALSDYLIDIGLQNVKVKWPNDIFVGNKKVAGVLIENVLQGRSIKHSFVGVGLNVNQLVFDESLLNASSMAILLDQQFEVKEVMNDVCNNIEKRYLLLKTNQFAKVKEDYLKRLYRLNASSIYEVNGERVNGEITGVADDGRLQLIVGTEKKCYDMKEIKYIIDGL